MRKILASLLLLSFNAYSYPLGIQGQSGAVNYPAVVKVPYNQNTVVSGGSLLETNSENMLLNPNFEAPTLSGWTCTSGTCTIESTVFSSGKQSAKIVPAANIFDFSQQVNIPANIQKQGVMGLIYNFPATCTTASVQTIVDGTVQTTVPTTNLILDGAFHSIEIPTVFGAISAKIRAFSTATCSGNIYIDKAYISQGIGYQNLMLDNVYSAQITTTSGAISNQNKTFISSCTAANPTVCTFTTGIFTVAPTCVTMAINNGVLAQVSAISAPSVSFQTTNAGTAVAAASIPLYVSCQKSGNDYLASSANVYSSTNGNYDWTSYTPTLVGFGSPTGIDFKQRRVGGDLEVIGSFVNGTPTAVTAKISLPSGLSIDANRVLGTQRTYLGALYRGVFNTTNSVPQIQMGPTPIVEDTPTSTTDVFFSYQTNSSASTFAISVGTGIAGVAGDTMVVRFTVPIAGWSTSNVIVGSFEKIEKCASVAECIDVVSAKFSSSGVISDLNLPGAMSLTSLTDTSLYTIAFSGFTSIPTCTVSSVDNAATNGTYARIDSISLSSIVIRTFYTSGALIKNPYPFNLSCQKTGVDSKPKTAKIASSIGVPTVPGITTEAIDTFSVSFGESSLSTVCSTSPCYIDQFGQAGSKGIQSGGAVTSITRSSVGAYVLNTTKTYTKLKCMSSVNTNTIVNLLQATMGCTSCSSLPFSYVQPTVAYIDSFATLMCQGSY